MGGRSGSLGEHGMNKILSRVLGKKQGRSGRDSSESLTKEGPDDIYLLQKLPLGQKKMAFTALPSAGPERQNLFLQVRKWASGKKIYPRKENRKTRLRKWTGAGGPIFTGKRRGRGG